MPIDPPTSTNTSPTPSDQNQTTPQARNTPATLPTTSTNLNTRKTAPNVYAAFVYQYGILDPEFEKQATLIRLAAQKDKNSPLYGKPREIIDQLLFEAIPLHNEIKEALLNDKKELMNELVQLAKKNGPIDLTKEIETIRQIRIDFSGYNTCGNGSKLERFSDKSGHELYTNIDPSMSFSATRLFDLYYLGSSHIQFGESIEFYAPPDNIDMTEMKEPSKLGFLSIMEKLLNINHQLPSEIRNKKPFAEIAKDMLNNLDLLKSYDDRKPPEKKE